LLLSGIHIISCYFKKGVQSTRFQRERPPGSTYEGFLCAGVIFKSTSADSRRGYGQRLNKTIILNSIKKESGMT